MIPWETLDTATIPGGAETLRLKRRGTEFSIMLGTNELMNSRLSGSEEALARLTIERLKAPAPRILIGGLGLGFTLRAALPLLPPAARVTVVELVSAVVRWARGPLAALHGDSLDDRRVTILEEDVGQTIRASKAEWDAILLDVDNGPEGLSRAGNDALYSTAGLAAARAALAPGGVLSVWSAGPDAKFTRRLRASGLEVEEIAVRAGTTKRGARHVVWVGRKG
ncbi:spermidine synthase [Chelativorans sp. ZYF759]|uniref:spermine/spermidine synthase domain-containing protein n=1 Tax=Chelativorans sp. ZYF759 TaxID=2692213 RepID=UPI00145F1E38|nr:spermidine synthase [Chelativorans sp. ZYF759]NMG39019.1 spermidine synthase [Chelativorans sp. ZYF759]